MCIIPLINNEYGAYDNLRNLDAECWVRDPIYYLTLYIPVLIAVLFALFLLICVWIKFFNTYKNQRLAGMGIQDSIIIKRLTLFTIVFIFVWITPLSDRLYTVITNKDAPFWLTVCHHCGVGLIGLGNAFIWANSKQFQSFTQSYQLMSYNKQEKDAMQFRDQLWNDANL